LFSLTNVLVSTAIGAVIGGIVGFAIGRAAGIGGARGAILGIIFGGALGFGFARGKFFSVLFSGLIDGFVNFVIELAMYHLYDTSSNAGEPGYSESTILKFADAFFKGLAYGALSAAVSIKLAGKKWGAVGGGAMAALVSLFTDFVEAVRSRQMPSFEKLLADATVAFILGIATQPQILFPLGRGKHSYAVLDEAGQSIMRNINRIKLGMVKLTEVVTGGAVSFFVRSMENYDTSLEEDIDWFGTM